MIKIKVYEINSEDFTDCKHKGTTFIKAVTVSDVISLLEEIRELTLMYGEKHTGLGILRTQVTMKISELK